MVGIVHHIHDYVGDREPGDVHRAPILSMVRVVQRIHVASEGVGPLLNNTFTTVFLPPGSPFGACLLPRLGGGMAAG